MNNYLALLAIVTVSSGASTVIGAAGGLLVRNLPHKFHDILLGAASGIMLAAAVLGLIFPAAEMELVAVLNLDLLIKRDDDTCIYSLLVKLYRQASYNVCKTADFDKRTAL